ncbi:MAG: C-GCAxxG-C-C family (seleno)protein [Victivallales bacterium]|nr:C-GCAxxG-C-C family (seleno)protein [Victivallales bacterium]
MPIEKAKTAYAQEKLNCAQSVLRGFQDCLSVADEQIAAAQKLGGGRAEGGRCGALYAARTLAPNDAAREEISRRFVARAGSDQCREIRRQKHLSCSGCVELAATLLHAETAEKPRRG